MTDSQVAERHLCESLDGRPTSNFSAGEAGIVGCQFAIECMRTANDILTVGHPGGCSRVSYVRLIQRRINRLAVAMVCGELRALSLKPMLVYTRVAIAASSTKALLDELGTQLLRDVSRCP